MFGFIALVILGMLVIYLMQGPVDYLIAGGLFVSFLACAIPALYLLKPYGTREEFLQIKEERERREKEATDEAEDSKS